MPSVPHHVTMCNTFLPRFRKANIPSDPKVRVTMRSGQLPTKHHLPRGGACDERRSPSHSQKPCVPFLTKLFHAMNPRSQCCITLSHTLPTKLSGFTKLAITSATLRSPSRTCRPSTSHPSHGDCVLVSRTRSDTGSAVMQSNTNGAFRYVRAFHVGTPLELGTH